ncbi:hypothetical protein [Sorangium sp. So ce1182]|uniref:hypothetical protein n=1 Tax=Sorangium sp. So ce1182 TaxID=3133334 RepID=UPI003F64841A
MRKVFSVALSVVAGFFFCTVSLLGFIPTQSPGMKWGVMVGLTVPAILALCCGLALERFHGWKRDTGTVLLCSSGFAAFIVLTVACMLMTEDFRKMMQINTLELFSDHFTGGATIVGFAGLGWLLLKKS